MTQTPELTNSQIAIINEAQYAFAHLIKKYDLKSISIGVIRSNNVDGKHVYTGSVQDAFRAFLGPDYKSCALQIQSALNLFALENPSQQQRLNNEIVATKARLASLEVMRVSA